jgi:hypothetical protein
MKTNENRMKTNWVENQLGFHIQQFEILNQMLYRHYSSLQQLAAGFSHPYADSLPIL